jgi:hypothetical protein
MEKIDEISELFELFHDATILEIFYNKPILVFRIKIPWYWDDHNFEILLEISGCNDLFCSYGVLIIDPFNPKSLVYCKSEERSTTEPDEITKLQLEIQSFELHDPNTFEFFCNSSAHLIAGGNLKFSADDYRLFDNKGKEITIEHMNNWFDDFWKRKNSQL